MNIVKKVKRERPCLNALVILPAEKSKAETKFKKENWDVMPPRGIYRSEARQSYLRCTERDRQIRYSESVSLVYNSNSS